MPPRKKKAQPASVGLAANQVMSEAPPEDVEALTNAIDADGGTVLARYREPYGATWVVMAVLRGKMGAAIRQTVARGALALPESMPPQPLLNRLKRLGHPTKPRGNGRIMER